jgi:hypothetical protein
MVRRVPLAFDALTAALVGLGFVAQQTLDLGELVPPRVLPILTAAVLQTAIGLRHRDGWRCLIGAGGLAASAMIALPATGAGNHQGPIAFHLILATVMVIGAAFDDRLGRVLRAAGAAMALLASLVVLSGRFERTGAVPTWAMDVYPLAMAMAIAGYGFMLGHRTSRTAAGLILAAWLVAFGCRGYGSLRRVVTGLDYIAIGLVFFSLAVLTSMAKGGALPRRILDHKEKIPDARE